MGEGKTAAGMLIVFIVIYFTIFTFMVDSVRNIETTTTINNNLYNTQFSLIGNGFCADPRFSYDAVTGEKYESPDKRSLECQATPGVLGKTYCERLEGCTWDNVTSTYWFFWQTTGAASCVGNVNASYYNIDTTVINNKFVSAHNNTGTIASLFGGTSVCNHPNVIYNESLCSYFGCSFNEGAFETDVSYKGIWSTVSEIFSFQYDFGFSSPALLTIFNFVFVGIPLLVLLIALYAIIPFI